MRWLRSLGALAAGLTVTVVLSVVTDMAMTSLGVFGPDGVPKGTEGFVIATLYRLFYNVDGCWIAARIAPSQPMGHALALGLIGMGLATIGLIAGAGSGPLWYPIALVVTALPCAWLGGRLAKRKSAGAIPAR